jgi:hypothetical protein
MTQTHTPASPPAPAIAWCQALQLKLMAALDAAWAIIERTDDPARIRQARDRAKAIGEIAAMGRKVAQFMPTARTAQAAKEGAAKQAPAGLSLEPLTAALAPFAGSMTAPPTQAEIARRALDKLKGGRRGRL